MGQAENTKRIVTAILLAGVIVAAIMLLSSFQFTIVVGLVSAGAAWEWCRLGRVMAPVTRNIAFIFLIGVGVPALSIFPFFLPWILGIALLWWISITILIVLGRRQSDAPRWPAKKSHALLIILPAAVAISGLHASGSEGRWYVLACLLIIWTTDTCGYMVGRVFGKTLLSPGISPAKTVEGVGGGLVGALIVGLIVFETLPTEMLVSRLNWTVLIVLTSGFSVIGDLAESIYKRTAGVKDSGSILPGHGGILDRIDSTFASSPVFVAGILLATR